jgi:hypothetical protein
VRSKHLLGVLAGFAAITFLAAEASATYHPTLGRWLQRDPIGYIEGMSLYAYAAAMPPNAVDPLGTTISVRSYHGVHDVSVWQGYKGKKYRVGPTRKNFENEAMGLLNKGCPCLEYQLKYEEGQSTNKHDTWSVSYSPKMKDWPKEAEKDEKFRCCIEKYAEPCRAIAQAFEDSKQRRIEDVKGKGAFYNPVSGVIGIDPGEPIGYTFFRDPITGYDVIGLMRQDGYTLLHEITHSLMKYDKSWTAPRRSVKRRGGEKTMPDPMHSDDVGPLRMEQIAQEAGGDPIRQFYGVWGSEEEAEDAFSKAP